MKKDFLKVALGMVLCAGIASPVMAEAAAGDAELADFTLESIVVTAQREATRDLDTPAAVEVFTRKDIVKSGALNAYDVLRNTLGVTAHSQGFNGSSMGTMTSRIMIRGVEKRYSCNAERRSYEP